MALWNFDRFLIFLWKYVANSDSIHFSLGWLYGPPAVIGYEPRQARKGAAVVVDSGAGMWLLKLPPNIKVAMSYQVLARKWRPHNFSQMVGQEHVLKALVNSLNQQRLHHAYLFSGTRGVGKTTVARILAKALNCEQGISATPCEQCKICKDISAGQFIDLIEVDAASRTKVEDTREILDNVPYLPSQGRFKIYLIDEVHMLSGHSFNALLKTLEEPPAHVKFLFATTEPQKLPVTILSRCLQFNLKNMLPEQISAHLKTILDNENYPYQLGALNHIAQAASGSMRDALSLLDQALAFGNNTVEEANICQMLGFVEQTYILDLLTALANNDSNHLLDISRQLSQQGANFHHALDELLTALHRITVLQCVPQPQSKQTHDDQDKLQYLAQTLEPQDIQLFYQIALKGRQDIDFAPTVAIGFEMTLLRMIAFQPASKQPVPPKEKLPQLEQSNQQEPTPVPRQKKNSDLTPDGCAAAEKLEKPLIQPPVIEHHPKRAAPLTTPSSDDLALGDKVKHAPIPANTTPMPPQAEQSLTFEDDLGPLHLAEVDDLPQPYAPSPEPIAINNHQSANEAPPLFAEDTNTLDEIPSKNESDIVTAHTTLPYREQSSGEREETSSQHEDALNWEQTIPQLKLSGMALNVLKHTQIKSFTDESLELQIEASHQSLLTQATQDRINSAICQYFNKPYRIHYLASDTLVHSPARKQEKERQQLATEAEHSIKHDPTVQKIIQQFDASIVQGSIQASKKLVE